MDGNKSSEREMRQHRTIQKREKEKFKDNTKNENRKKFINQGYLHLNESY
jgi:hypothetical protein